MNKEKVLNLSAVESKKSAKEDLCLDRALLRQRGALRVKSALRAGKPPSDIGVHGEKA